MLGVKAAGLVPADASWVLGLAAVLLALCIFASVHHAEVLALKLGEPFGSILLAVAVTVIEVGLVVSIMLSGSPAAEHIARDTVFSAVMIVTTGVVGLCLLMGGRRHHVQVFQLQGAAAALAVLGTLSCLTLILPNFTFTVAGPYYSTAQMMFVSVASLLLWGIFVFVQTVKHRDYFLDDAEEDHDGPHAKPGNGVAAASLLLLIIALTAVVLLAKVLSAPLAQAVAMAGFPQAFVGVLVAAIVLLPESIAAMSSAVKNKLQNSINLALGSGIASIGLTIPAVAMVSQWLGMKVALGISPANIVLLALSLFVSAITLGTGRTTLLQGAVHLVIFGAFITVSAVP